MTLSSLSWLDPVVDRCGFGWFQLRLLIQTGATGFASAAIFVILGSMIGHLPLERWGVSRAEATLLQSAIFVGVTCGTLLGGVFADKYGRRQAVLLSYMLLGLAAALLVSAWGYYVMVTACFMFGAVGGFSLPAMNALLVENSPQRHRGELVCLSSVLWFTGELYGAGCVWFLGEADLPLPGEPESGFHWRACFLMGFMPAVPVVIYAFFTLQESPRFLASQGRFREAELCLALMASKNGVETPKFPAQDGENQTVVEPPPQEPLSVSLQLLMKWPVNISTAGLMVLCIVCNFAYYGLIFALPQILHDQGRGASLFGGASVQVFIVTLFKIPGILVAFLLLRTPSVGHKPCLAVLLGFTAFSAWSYPELVGIGAMTGAFSAACCLKLATSAAFIILYVFVLEVYPTQIRSTGMAICTMVGRVGSIMSPVVHSFAVASAGNHAYFMTIAFSTLVAAGSALLMPHDTKGRPLGESPQLEGRVPWGEDGETQRLLPYKK
jgi:putative MFS transporter